MTKNSTNINESAKRYAKALMLSSEGRSLTITNFQNDYDKLLSLYEKSNEFKKALSYPHSIKKLKKNVFLIKILKKMNLSNEFLNFFKIVANHGKLFLLERIYKEFKKSLDEKEGITEVNSNNNVTTREEI